MALPKIYSASKIWHAAKFRELRDSFKFPIISQWIDFPEDPEDPWIKNCKDELWDACLQDCQNADLAIIYCKEFDEEQRGAVMEAGHVMGAGKPVYCVNTCKTFTPNAISDVAFTHHPLWTWIRRDNHLFTPLEGFALALAHYNSNHIPEAGEIVHGPWGKLKVS
jgi:nucleoside 2-deoxyribosyltransferase